MEMKQKKELKIAQKELLTFINPIDAPCIAKALRTVFNLALFDNFNATTNTDKDDLFILEKIIQLTEKI